MTTSDDERLENHRAPDTALPGGPPRRRTDRAAALYTLIETARLNDVDPRAWLADVFARINDHPAKAIDDLLPWNWKAGNQADIAA